MITLNDYPLPDKGPGLLLQILTVSRSPSRYPTIAQLLAFHVFWIVATLAAQKLVSICAYGFPDYTGIIISSSLTTLLYLKSRQMRIDYLERVWQVQMGLECRCGYDRRGLPLKSKCPECGKIYWPDYLAESNA